MSSEKAELPTPTFSDFFDDFWGSQGKPKMSKHKKNAFRKSIEKKEAKKEATPPSPGSSAAAFARPVGMQDSCSGRCLP